MCSLLACILMFTAVALTDNQLTRHFECKLNKNNNNDENAFFW